MAQAPIMRDKHHSTSTETSETKYTGWPSELVQTQL